MDRNAKQHPSSGGRVDSSADPTRHEIARKEIPRTAGNRMQQGQYMDELGRGASLDLAGPSYSHNTAREDGARPWTQKAVRRTGDKLGSAGGVLGGGIEVSTTSLSLSSPPLGRASYEAQKRLSGMTPAEFLKRQQQQQPQQKMQAGAKRISIGSLRSVDSKGQKPGVRGLLRIMSWNADGGQEQHTNRSNSKAPKRQRAQEGLFGIFQRQYRKEDDTLEKEPSAPLDPATAFSDAVGPHVYPTSGSRPSIDMATSASGPFQQPSPVQEDPTHSATSWTSDYQAVLENQLMVPPEEMSPISKDILAARGLLVSLPPMRPETAGGIPTERRRPRQHRPLPVPSNLTRSRAAALSRLTTTTSALNFTGDLLNSKTAGARVSERHKTPEKDAEAEANCSRQRRELEASTTRPKKKQPNSSLLPVVVPVRPSPRNEKSTSTTATTDTTPRNDAGSQAPVDQENDRHQPQQQPQQHQQAVVEASVMAWLVNDGLGSGRITHRCRQCGAEVKMRFLIVKD